MKDKMLLLNCKIAKYFSNPLPLLIYVSIILSFSCSRISYRKDMQNNSLLIKMPSKRNIDNKAMCLLNIFSKFWNTISLSKFLNYEDRVHLESVCKNINRVLKDNYNFILKLPFYIEANATNHADIFFPTIYEGYKIEKILSKANEIELISILKESQYNLKDTEFNEYDSDYFNETLVYNYLTKIKSININNIDEDFVEIPSVLSFLFQNTIFTNVTNLTLEKNIFKHDTEIFDGASLTQRFPAINLNSCRIFKNSTIKDSTIEVFDFSSSDIPKPDLQDFLYRFSKLSVANIFEFLSLYSLKQVASTSRFWCNEIIRHKNSTCKIIGFFSDYIFENLDDNSDCVLFLFPIAQINPLRKNIKLVFTGVDSDAYKINKLLGLELEESVRYCIENKKKIKVNTIKQPPYLNLSKSYLYPISYNLLGYTNYITEIHNATTYIISELARKDIRLPKVTYLSICGIYDLSGYSIDEFELMKIWDCEDNESILPNLENLKIDLAGYFYSENTFLCFKRHNKLKSITISSKTVLESFFFHGCDKITELYLNLDSLGKEALFSDDLEIKKIGDIEYSEIDLIGELTNLKKLSIIMSKNILTNSIPKLIRTVKSLSYLSLTYHPSALLNNNLKLSFLKELTSLEYLFLEIFSPLDNSKIQIPSGEELRFIREKNIIIHEN